MYRKIISLLVCVAMTAAFAGCDKSSSSSSSSGSSGESSEELQIVTEADDKELTPEEIAELTELVSKEILENSWKSDVVTDENGKNYSIADYCEKISSDPMIFDMQADFSDDGKLVFKIADQEESYDYTVEGKKITAKSNTGSSDIEFSYDKKNKILNFVFGQDVLIGLTPS